MTSTDPGKSQSSFRVVSRLFYEKNPLLEKRSSGSAKNELFTAVNINVGQLKHRESFAEMFLVWRRKSLNGNTFRALQKVEKAPLNEL